MGLLSIGKFAKASGLSVSTLRRLHATGELVPCHITDSGTRYYSQDQLDSLTTPERATRMGDKPAVGYCRVSTRAQKDDLETQVSNVEAYMAARGYQYSIIQDIGSGINYDKQGLHELLRLINERQVSRVVVLYRDRLVRFGFELIEYLCRLNDVTLEVVDHTAHSREQELSDDLIQIVTVFANRLYGARSKRTRTLIGEVKRHADGQEDTTAADQRTGDAVS